MFTLCACVGAAESKDTFVERLYRDYIVQTACRNHITYVDGLHILICNAFYSDATEYTRTVL